MSKYAFGFLVFITLICLAPSLVFAIDTNLNITTKKATIYTCNCDYEKTCGDEKNVTWTTVTGKTTKTQTYGPAIDFKQPEQCYGQIKSAFDKNVNDGDLCKAECRLWSCQWEYGDVLGYEKGVIVPKSCTVQSQMKWTTDFGSASNPLSVSWGKILETEYAKAEGAANISFLCPDCEKDGAVLESPGGGKVKIIWDTSKMDLSSAIDKNEPMHITIFAKDDDDPTGGALTGTFYVKIDPPECEKLTAGINCETDLKNCMKKCDEANKLCAMSNGVCKYKGALTTEEVNKVSAEETKAYLEDTYKVPGGYIGALPPCAFSGTCRKLNDLTQLIVNFGKGMFAIIGTFAFAFFVYGGFTMIVSMGNAEKQKKGTQILVAAVIGIVIAFSAYLLIDFMLDALNVAPTFRGIK